MTLRPETCQVSLSLDDGKGRVMDVYRTAYLMSVGVFFTNVASFAINFILLSDNPIALGCVVATSHAA